ncbi:MAG: DUF2806 domain-containing protein [Alphaproteobacteria bacterium]|nr:DUF2806 domain-containing protein [Alphaproteobacteria bacterium]
MSKTPHPRRASRCRLALASLTIVLSRRWLPLSVIGFFGSEHRNWVDACLEHQARRRQANLDVILLLALARLPGRLDKGDIDIDWAARLFNVPADWSGPEHQTIWARLLVMEDWKLGAVPPVAMQVLASLSPRLLEWVRVLAELTINNFLLRLSDEFNAERGRVGDVVLLLRQYGLLRTNSETMKVLRSQITANLTANFLYNYKILRINHGDPKKDLTMPYYRFSDASTELCNAVLQ